MLKYTVRLQLRETDPTTKGLYPIYLCITINRQRSYLATGIATTQKAWDDAGERIRESHPLHAQYNADLAARKMKIVQMISEAQVKGEPITAAEVKQRLTATTDLHNIFDFIEQFTKECRGKKKDSTLKNYTNHARRLELFHGSRKLAFEDITPEFLSRYEAHLRHPTKEGCEPVDGNYVHALWRTLKTFFNAARKRKLITCYPFDQYENPVYEGPVKAYLTLAELQAWEAFASRVKNPTQKQAATWFLLGCYTGLRVSDWFRFNLDEHVSDGRIRIRAKKNGEWVSMPVSKPLQRNLARMRAHPLTISEQEVNRTIQDVAKLLRIPKHLTTHAGRHTFAVAVCADRGISAETCATLMGITPAVCIAAYYRVTNRKIDQETEKAWKGL